MNKKDYNNLEQQIMSTVTDALKAIDIAGLKGDINYKTEDTINQLKQKYNVYIEKYMGLSKHPKKDILRYISKRPAGSVSSVVYIVVGTSASAISALSAGTYLIANTVFGSIIASSGMVWGVIIVLSAGSVGLLLKGISDRKRLKRFKKYVKIIDYKSYIPIEDLAKYSNQKKKFVAKDLKKMIDLEMFLEGHIDEDKTYFIISDEVYADYLDMKKQQISNESSNIKREEVDATVEIGRAYIEEIKVIKNKLYKEKIGTKIDKLQNIANEILKQIERNPKKVHEVNKFINHYLPITIKLISSYKELNNQVVQGKNIKNAKNEIERSIDLINSAFENLLDDLYEDVVLDISTDISVLETLFKQDGLAEEDFKK